MRMTRKTTKRIWVLCGGPSTEFDVSLSSGKCVCQAINGETNTVTPVVVTRGGRWIISDRQVTGSESREWLDDFFTNAAADWNQESLPLSDALQAMIDSQVDCVFLAFHGQYGEDGAIQGLLQTAGIPYTGSGILASSLAFNKVASLDIFAKAGLPTARSVVATRQQPYPDGLAELNFPVFTKPVCGGSSLGVSLVHSEDELEAGIMHALEHDVRAMIEERIPGLEVSCAVIDVIHKNQVKPRALPPTLISPLNAEFFDYDAKYTPGRSRDTTPAPLEPNLLEMIQKTALQAHKALFCEGMSRTDMIIDPDGDALPYILETQTLPGMTPTSLLPQQCVAGGITFAEFIEQLIDHGIMRSSSGGKHYG